MAFFSWAGKCHSLALVFWIASKDAWGENWCLKQSLGLNGKCIAGSNYLEQEEAFESSSLPWHSWAVYKYLICNLGIILRGFEVSASFSDHELTIVPHGGVGLISPFSIALPLVIKSWRGLVAQWWWRSGPSRGRSVAVERQGSDHPPTFYGASEKSKFHSEKLSC